MHAKTTVLKQANTLAPKRFMDINIDNQQAIFVERLRTIDDLPVVLDQDYLPFLPKWISLAPRYSG